MSFPELLQSIQDTFAAVPESVLLLFAGFIISSAVQFLIGVSRSSRSSSASSKYSRSSSFNNNARSSSNNNSSSKNNRSSHSVQVKRTSLSGQVYYQTRIKKK